MRYTTKVRIFLIRCDFGVLRKTLLTRLAGGIHRRPNAAADGCPRAPVRQRKTFICAPAGYAVLFLADKTKLASDIIRASSAMYTGFLPYRVAVRGHQLSGRWH